LRACRLSAAAAAAAPDRRGRDDGQPAGRLGSSLRLARLLPGSRRLQREVFVRGARWRTVPRGLRGDQEAESAGRAGQGVQRVRSSVGSKRCPRRRWMSLLASVARRVRVSAASAPSAAARGVGRSGASTRGLAVMAGSGRSGVALGAGGGVLDLPTADLCDRFGDEVRYVDEMGLRDFGGVRHFGTCACLRVLSRRYELTPQGTMRSGHRLHGALPGRQHTY
jgi:hypothetical protein